VFTDHTGRKVFADRTGATYGDTGEPAPTPGDLIGTDPDVLLALMTIRAKDLGLDNDRSVSDRRHDLEAARGAIKPLEGEVTAARSAAAAHDELKHQLNDIERKLDRAEDDGARWAWVELRRRADAVQAELAVIDQGPAADADARLLAAVEEVRQRGAAWAEAATDVGELRARLGEEPTVSSSDLERVAATPAAAPDDLLSRVEAWEQAAATRRRAEVEADRVPGEVAPVADDPLVSVLARLDQAALWTAFAALTAAEADYAEAAKAMGPEEGEIDPAIETEIESSHLEVVRNERRVEQRNLPGLLLTTAMIASTLLTIRFGIVFAVLTLAAAVAAAWCLLVLPRRALRAARDDEDFQLGRAGAATWLGLHLRRLDGPPDAATGEAMETAANARVAALVDWRDLVGDTELDDVGGREAAIRSHADAIDPVARQNRIAAARAAADTARRAEHDAAHQVARGLDGYGIRPDVAPGEVQALVDERIAAGSHARDWQRLYARQADATAAAHELDDVLIGLGFDQGGLELRLDRVVDAIARARERQEPGAGRRTRTEVTAELRSLQIEVEATRRDHWAGNDPQQPPVAPDLLEEQRDEAVAAVARSVRPDITAAEQRLELMVERVAELERELGEGVDGPAPLHKRLIAKVARTMWQGGVEESVPIILDDPLAAVPADQRCDLLDMLVRLSDKTQVIYLTEDPVVARWARQRPHDGSLLLFETDTVNV
jgi:hypothetical protein